MTAYSDDTRVLYRLLHAGEDVTVTAQRRVRIRTGDAGALSYRVGDGESRAAGAPGDVRDLTVSARTTRDGSTR